MLRPAEGAALGKKAGDETAMRDSGGWFINVVIVQVLSPTSAVVRFDGDFRQGEQVTLQFEPGVLEYP
jgi:hypothetical protein